MPDHPLLHDGPFADTPMHESLAGLRCGAGICASDAAHATISLLLSQRSPIHRA